MEKDRLWVLQVVQGQGGQGDCTEEVQRGGYINFGSGPEDFVINTCESGGFRGRDDHKKGDGELAVSLQKQGKKDNTSPEIEIDCLAWDL